MRFGMIAAVVALGLGGCIVQPEPFSMEENLARVSADLARLDVHSAPPRGPISLEEAQARALAYNLENRLQIFNAALQDRQLDLTKLDMLPALTANAGYVSRNKDLVSSSASYISGVISPTNYQTVSVERERAFGDLTLSWNIVDFGVSYLQAKQQADRVEVAKEQRRRVVNNIFQQVRNAYWTAAAAERIGPRLKPILSEARAALASSRAIEKERSQQPLEALKYQRALTELIQELEAVDDKLLIAKTQLAELMGLRPGTPYRLSIPQALSYTAPRRLTIDEMERVALVNRPELREEGYNTRIAQQEGRRALLRLVPGINLLTSLNSDSNSYLLYNNWQESSARMAVSFIRLLSIPGVMKLNEAQAEIAETRRLATTMAVLAQVQIAAQQYAIASKNYQRASSLADVNRRIAAVSADARAAESASDLDIIWEKANAALSELRRNRAYADLQNADASIYVTLGLDPLPDGIETTDIGALVAAIRERSAEWRRGKIPVPQVDRVPEAQFASAAPEPTEQAKQ